MTMKEQERKALAQIRKIVAGLGDDSYVATAFEGCFEIAEENIENDFACSMKQRVESAERDAAYFKQAAESFSAELDEARLSHEAEVEKLQSEIAALRARLLCADDLIDCGAAIGDQLAEHEERLDAAAVEIVNSAEAPDGEAFRSAVRDHRNSKKAVDYCKALKSRIDAAISAWS